MCSTKKFLKTLELKEVGVVLLKNNKACNLQGIRSIIDNQEMLLA